MSMLGKRWSEAQHANAALRFGGSIEERFFARIEYDTNGGCWFWAGTIIPKTGYGQIQVDGRVISTHRLAWRLFNGADPGELSVCHRCDVRPCVNPAHLFLGTTLDNIADMVAKGRSAWGERNGNAKLTAADVAEIFRLRSDGWSQPKLGKRFGVSQVKISQILLGKAWAHAPRPAPAAQAPIEKVVHAGEAHHAAKVTEEDVRRIRAMAGSRPIAQIAREFGISRPSAARIIKRKTWAHVDPPTLSPKGAGGRTGVVA